MTLLRLLFSASVGCLVLAACGISRSETLPTVEELTPDRLPQLIRDAKGRAVIVNVWATWCAPCIEEFPDLLRVAQEREAEGVKLILVSTDFKQSLPAVRAFLAKRGVEGGSYRKTGPDEPFIQALSPDWSGAIPATFVFDGNGKLRRFHEGKADYAAFTQMVTDTLGKP